MYLKSIELSGFKSFGRKTELRFGSPIAAIVGPNGSGKSNVAEAFRFVLGEQSMKSLRSHRGEDLIWGGSASLSRANRAAVRVTFNNTPDRSGKRLFTVDFSEVVVERVVYRDCLNEYFLNGTQVRLKDVVRLFAGATIGGSGYHIISQGEADRILNASPKERREMVEDALGLKLYQHKKFESERKMEETKQNIEKTKSLRREIAPHLRFLRMQAEKIERARELREELAVQLRDYLAREHAWIEQESARTEEAIRAAEQEARAAEEKLKTLSQDIPAHAQPDPLADALRDAQEKALTARHARDTLSRELGRAEGVLTSATAQDEHLVPAHVVRDFAHGVDAELAKAESSGDISLLHTVVRNVRARIQDFVGGLIAATHAAHRDAQAEVERLTAALRAAQEEEDAAQKRVESIRKDIARAREAGLAAEAERLQLESVRREALRRVQQQRLVRESLADARTRFAEEVRESIALGIRVPQWEREDIPEGALAEDRSAQEKRRRAIERLKIKIEESGVAGGDAIMREYKVTKERDEFLAKELVDLETSAAALAGIIADLERTIDERFSEGIGRINEALDHFFKKLFGGGSAELFIEKPKMTREHDPVYDTDADEVEAAGGDVYAGLAVRVSLPRKKVHGLDALSGGERALTSIALIFSMTQVNPPPFLILDETDAALDEANSRRYADMIRELGEKSQLIVITHNRATMAAAGELFGVTMGADGISKILSVKLEEAERVAK